MRAPRDGATGDALSWSPARTASMCLVSLGGFVGCGVGTPCAPPRALCNSTTGEGSRFTGEARIERVILECCDSETASDGTCDGIGEWWVDVSIQGTARRAEITRSTLERGGWEEVHTVPLSARDPSGYWELRYDEWALADTDDCELYADCDDRYTAGSVTLLPCLNTEISTIRTSVRIYDLDATDPIDCVTWGTALPAAPEGCRDAQASGVL